MDKWFVNPYTYLKAESMDDLAQKKGSQGCLIAFRREGQSLFVRHDSIIR